jgi:DNA-binding response OmpR family regulator
LPRPGSFLRGAFALSANIALPVCAFIRKDIQKVKSMGADAYLVKGKSKLNEVVAKIKELLYQGRGGEESGEKKAPEILVFEDDKFFSELYQKILEQEKFVVRVAADGEEGVEILKKHKPDLIIMDLMLPRMKGYEAIWRIRADSHTSRIPILVVSAHDQPEEVKKAMLMGANDFLVKGKSNLSEMISKVQTLLKKTPERHYRIEIIETVLDAPSLAQSLGIDQDYRCADCGKPMVLDLTVKGENGNRELRGNFVCSSCRKPAESPKPVH